MLFLSDAALYMVKCGNYLSALYSKMIHVTCVAHGVQKTFEKVRGIFGTVDKIVTNVKKIFKKALSRLELFKTHAPDVPLPPEPVITRWGTLINVAIYYCEHYEKNCQIVSLLDLEEALSIKTTNKNLANNFVQSNLMYIKSNFKILPDSILKLQKKICL